MCLKIKLIKIATKAQISFRIKVFPNEKKIFDHFFVGKNLNIASVQSFNSYLPIFNGNHISNFTTNR